MSFQRDDVADKPRRGVAKLPPILGGVFVVLLLYALAGAATAFLAALMGLELLAGFLGGRLRWALAARKSFGRHFELARVLAGGLWLRKRVEACVPLTEADAPELFAILEPLCFRRGIDFPPKVFLDMEAGAFVRMTGFRRGARKVALSLGFDLLAGTTRTELEAVLAHELSHARLTQWAVGNWLARGLERAVQLSRGLFRLSTNRREKANTPSLARLFLRAADGLGESAARCIAAFSRQEEFEADQGAAEMAGVETFRAALLKVESLSRFSAKLPWQERMAQLQAQNFSAWLLKEFEKVKPLSAQELEAQLKDRFSTHPLLRDRLKALPTVGGATATDGRPALNILLDSDGVAEKLIAVLLKRSVEREEGDTRKLRRWVQQMRAATDLRPAQILGAALVIGSEIAGAAAWIIGAEMKVVAPIFGMSVLGVLLFVLGRYRERFTLPVPDFGLLKQTWSTEWSVRPEEIKRFESALESLVAGKSRRKAVPILAAKCFEALGEANYPKAAVASRLLLARDPQSPQGLLAAAISSAWHGQGEETMRALLAVQKNIGLKGPSLCWSMAWAFMLRGNWARAEALLEPITIKNPSDPTLLNLRALCQSRRGKIQSAITNSRRASDPKSRNIGHAKFLIDLLLEGGYVREARARMRPLEHEIHRDLDLMMANIRLDLLLRQFESADAWSLALRKTSPPPYMMVQLAAFHELAGRYEEAGRYYGEALAQAHYPDACLGLARVETQNNNVPAARRHALAALNFRRPLGQYATPPIELLRPILTQLAVLEPPVPAARAWMADVAAHALPAALAGMSFVVFAVNQAKAEKYLLSIVAAMSAGGPQLAATNITWRQAPPEHQPFGAVRPGVQPLRNGADSSPFRGFQRRGLWQPRHSRIQSVVDGLRLLPECAVAPGAAGSTDSDILQVA